MHSLKTIKEKGYNTPQQKQRLLHDIAESKGRQQLFAKQSPETLERLLDNAIIESVRASTSMEGVAVPEHSRLREMIRSAQWRPTTRDEEDIIAYKNALDFIYKRPGELSLDLIINLSNILWAHDKDKAGLKRKDNKFVLSYPDGTQILRFSPPSAKMTPDLLKKTCETYSSLIEDKQFIDHQIISAFVLDILCIHPLEDGNGRLARILHTYLLIGQGYEVGRYISLEGLVEKDKQQYYDTLYRSSKKWESGQHNLNPWMNFSLGKLNLAYKRFERQVVEAQQTYASKAERPEQTQAEKLLESLIIGQTFDRAFVEKESRVSGRTSRRALQKWVVNGRLVRIGAGRGTRYEKLR